MPSKNGVVSAVADCLHVSGAQVMCEVFLRYFEAPGAEHSHHFNSHRGLYASDRISDLFPISHAPVDPQAMSRRWLVEIQNYGWNSGAAVWENKRLKGSWNSTSSAWALVRTFLTATAHVTWTTFDDGSQVRGAAPRPGISDSSARE